MQWRTITTSLGNNAYTLWNNGRKLLTLNYKTQNNTVHLESEDGEKRYFKYRRKGLLRNKVILENEYGTSLGQLQGENQRKYILIEGKKYFFNFLENKKVAIIPEDEHKPLTVCSLDVDGATPRAETGLLMILCYYVLGHPQKIEEATLAV